jgi:hypothetical protein
MTKGGIMKRGVIAVVAVLSLVFAVPAFAVEGIQPSAGTVPDFEQMKTDHLKRLDDRINSLQEEKACVQAAKNKDDIRVCRSKHKVEMRGHGDEMRKRGGPGGPGGQVPPQVK